MDFQEVKRNSLQQKILFRGLSLFLAVILLLGSHANLFQDSVIENVFIGVGVSLLVWAGVEFWNISVEGYAQCINERIRFFKIIRENLCRQICFIKSVIEEGECFQGKNDIIINSLQGNYEEATARWKTMLENFYILQKQLEEEAFSMDYYLLTEEYDRICSYFERCVVLLNSCLGSEPQDVKKLLNEFIIRRKQKHDGQEQLKMFEKKLNDINEIAKISHKFRSMELNDKKLKFPEAIIEENKYYIINYEEIINFVDFSKSKFEELIFTPAEYIYNLQKGEFVEFSGDLKHTWGLFFSILKDKKG